MANSLIEDVFNEQPSNGNNGDNLGGGFNNQKPPKKKGKKKFIILFLIIVILIIVALFAIQYLQNPTTVISNKAKFFELLIGNNVESVANTDSYTDLADKLTSENSNVSTEISIDYETEDYSINNILVSINSQNDVENSKSYSNLTLNYSNNDLINIELLADSEKFGLKSDEVVNAYVGCDYEYLLENGESLIEETNSDEETLNDYSEDEEAMYYEYSYEDEDYELNSSLSVYASLLEDMDYESVIENLSNIDSFEMSEASIQIYENLINENLDESLFTSQEVTLETDNGNIDSTEYTLTLAASDFVNLLKEMLTALETDTETLDIIAQILNAFEIDESNISTTIQTLISELEQTEVSGENIVIKVYESEGQTIKVSLEYSYALIEIEYGYGDSINYIKTTILDSTSNSGFSFKIINEKLDLSNEFEFEVSVIEDSYEMAKLSASTRIIKSGSTYTVTMNASYKDSEENAITVDIETDITFEDVEVPSLEDEGYYALDEVSDEERESTLEAISEQINTVISNKASELSFIDTNTTTTIIQQNTTEITEKEDETENETEEDAKEEAKNVLVEAISNAMGEAQENGEEYTLENLETLEIEDHELSVSVSDDIAEVTIDGYTFNLDSEFNLSE